MSDYSREELEFLALAVCPTEEIYDLRDSIDGATDDALREIIETNKEELL